MRIPTTRIFAPAALIALSLLGCGAALSAQPAAADSVQAIIDRTLIRELMDQYGVVHDMGSPEEYADLFADDGEIATGGPASIKGRQALIAQARRDHERFDLEKGADGKPSSIMRHLISNAQVTLTSASTANGTCYVTTVVKKGSVGPAILSISRYLDSYTKKDGRWRIQRREIKLEFGNSDLAKELGFTSR